MSAIGRLSDVEGLLVGHAHELDDDATTASETVPGSGAATGCTVVLAPDGAVAAADVRGGGPGTRETDLLDPTHTVQHVHGLVLTGGSAYGLSVADGVMRYLEENGIGVPMGAPGLVVPIVPAAVVFDLPVGDWNVRPDAEFGFRAASSASTEFDSGSVGAGVGVRAGCLKGGVGTASLVVKDGPAQGITLSALMVVNPVGEVFDPRTGLPWGVGSDGPESFGLRVPDPQELESANELAAKGTVLNTTIGVVATDAPLGKAECKRLAVAGHDGLARAIRPAHSPLDGDTIFALSTGRHDGSADPHVVDGSRSPFPSNLAVVDALCREAALVVERVIVDAIVSAISVAGIPAYRETFPSAFRRDR
ncbi:P1 family peptidase [Rhodococcus sp. NPDC058521]|uniref:P1 family peptidase n=1 Tax=Rhodococcus sp. NPDC058521 TaxID=3346536 RepID=UPI0036651D85